MKYLKIFFILTGTLLFIMTGSFAGFARTHRAVLRKSNSSRTA